MAEVTKAARRAAQLAALLLALLAGSFATAGQEQHFAGAAATSALLEPEFARAGIPVEPGVVDKADARRIDRDEGSPDDGSALPSDRFALSFHADDEGRPVAVPAWLRGRQLSAYRARAPPWSELRAA